MATSTAIGNSAVARATGIKTIFKDLRAGRIRFLPQRIALVGQGSTLAVYALTKLQVTSSQQVGETYGFGSPVHLSSKQLFPVNGDGVGGIPVTVYPMEDDGSGVVSDGDITPGGAATVNAAYQVFVNNIPSAEFSVESGDNVASIVAAMTAAINSNIDMPIIATDGATEVTFISKWAGTSANDIFVAVEGTSTDVTFAITQANGGLVNPDVDAPLALFGDIWESLVINCLDLADVTTLGKYSVFGEGRWGALVKKPLVVFTGNPNAGVTGAIAIPDARPTDRVNSAPPAPGSNDLPFVIAAATVSRIAVRANDNPPFDYGSLDLPFLTPGADGEQWDGPEREQAVLGGSSTVQIKDAVFNISDTITFYKPTGEAVPAYRFVVDIVKLQTIIYNLDLIFSSPEWDGAPLVPDDQAISNRAAKKPRMAKAAIAELIDSLALNAIISDPDAAKIATIAVINDQNPKRLDICMTVQLSGNTNIKSIDLNFGFFFGTLPLVS